MDHLFRMYNWILSGPRFLLFSILGSVRFSTNIQVSTGTKYVCLICLCAHNLHTFYTYRNSCRGDNGDGLMKQLGSTFCSWSLHSFSTFHHSLNHYFLLLTPIRKCNGTLSKWFDVWKWTVVAWTIHSYANRQLAVDSAYRIGNLWLAAQTRIINVPINTKNGTKWSLTHQQTNKMTSSLSHSLHTVKMTAKHSKKMTKIALIG